MADLNSRESSLRKLKYPGTQAGNQALLCLLFDPFFKRLDNDFATKTEEPFIFRHFHEKVRFLSKIS